jgi:hypothetical protein
MKPLKLAFQPVRKSLFSESSDPHYVGPIRVELAADGIRWWWDTGTDDAGPSDVTHITPAMLVENALLHEVIDIKHEVRCAEAYLQQAKKRIVALDRVRSFKVIPCE